MKGSRSGAGLAGNDPKAPPWPVYLDEETKKLGTKLADARRSKRELREKGLSTAGIDTEIQSLRFRIREGGQLRAGDWLDDRFLLIDLAGRGGFGSVWKAFDERRQEVVAVKVLHPEIAADPVKRNRFFHGARTMVELGHESIVRVIEPHGEDGRFYFFVMEFIDGVDLREAVRSGAMTGENAIPLVLQVGEALAAAHAKGYTHRDVKPANILLTKLGAPRLTDFDLVHDPDKTYLTRTGPMGTLLYGAPEILTQPQAAKPSADVYSLGMTLIFCLRGDDLPEHGADTEALIAQLPAGAALKAALRKAVQRNPNLRYEDAAEFCEAIKKALVSDAGAPKRRLAAGAFAAVLLGAGAYGMGSISRCSGLLPPPMPKPDPPLAITMSPASSASPASLMDASVPAVHDAAVDAAVEDAPVEASVVPEPVVECPNDMKRIGAGQFMMGTPPGGGGVRSQKVVLGEDFCMDTTEVTVEAYEACIAAKGCTSPASDSEVMFCSSARKNKIPDGEPQGKHPMTCINWRQANAFCEWAQKRLPTEEEWEFAARGTKSSRFPWGDLWPGPALLNACDQRCSGYYVSINEGTAAEKVMFMADDGNAMTAKVGSYPKGASPFGLVDMAGNVAEWVAGSYCAYKDDSCGAGDSRRVARGGSWRTVLAAHAEAAFREALPDKAFNYVGVRCAKSLR